MKSVKEIPDPRALMARIRSNCTEDADCWIWQRYCDPHQMPILSINHMPMAVRRAVWIVKHGEVQDGFEIVHTCGRTRCVNPAHLESITMAERRKRLGEAARGRASVAMVKTHRAMGKLDMEKAREIRSSDETGQVLAAKFGVTPQLVSLVRRGKSWAEPSPFSGLGARP